MRAAANRLTAGLLENMWRNLAAASGRPRSSRISVRTAISAIAIMPASSASATRNPTTLSSSAPTKNPTPLSAFFEPVRIATHLYSVPGASSGTISFTALLELIFVRSFAIPDKACAAITYGTTSQDAGGTASIPSAASCTLSPPISVARRPSRAARKPPTRFVMMPKTS